MTTEVLPGLTTTKALQTLYNEISSLRNYTKEQQTERYLVFNCFIFFFCCAWIIIIRYLVFNRGKDKLWIQDALKYNSQFTSICWITAWVILVCGFSFIIISLVFNELWYLFDDGILILLLLIINLATVLWDNKLRHEEMFTKLDYVIKRLGCKKILLKIFI